MNKCDIAEVKHMAIQKFLELIDEPWEVRDYGYGDGYEFKHKKFKVTITSYMYPIWTVYIGDETIWSRFGPFNFAHTRTKKGQPTKKSLAKEAAARKEWEADEVYQAILTLDQRRRELENRKRCEKAKRALEESCKKIQKELKGNQLDAIFNPAPVEVVPWNKDTRTWWQRFLNFR